MMVVEMMAVGFFEPAATRTPMIVAGIGAGDRMGVTVEPAGGASSPTSPAVLMLSLPAA